ncbi:MAG: ATP-dependent DNA helicase RecG [Candidatus Omnitrophica bacterium]|nr:ATP-dependent DNA helicase RecG [Candidatus Omnitrophota bacterium]
MKKLRDIPIQFIKGVGPSRKKLFNNLGIENVEDLMYFFPRRYEDRRRISPISMVQTGEYQTVTGKVLAKRSRRSWYTKKHLSEIMVDDGSGRLHCVWFNQPYLEKYFRAGKQIVLYGKADIYKERLQMVSPEWELIDSDTDDQKYSIGCIVPIYPLTRGMTQRYLRKAVRASLDKYLNDLTDALPVWLRNKHHLVNIKRSIASIHMPEDFDIQQKAMSRISFEEFFIFQISVLKRRLSIVMKEGVAHNVNLNLVNAYKNLFPFPLTQAQKKVINEIAGDMQQTVPMLRLLQGDVGCGKTIVALFGCVAAFHNGLQSAIMAPTEILVRQHYDNVTKILQEFKGPEGNSPRVALLISGLPKKERDAVKRKIANKEVDIVIGTHALISEEVNFKNLSFVVIDEQHKFGVKQRALLSRKGLNPDILVMTATPIPRTLSLTLFGDLDVSVINEMPPGRGKVETTLYPQKEAPYVYKQVRNQVRAGKQAFIIYPLVEESDKLDLKAAEGMFKEFQQKIFKDFKIGLVHGQMPRSQVDVVMEQFKGNEIHILVSTTVVEVGVDIPNASVMVIEHAERFGLAQLHQLRGRIGRGKQNGECLLLAEATTEEGQQRLQVILSTSDGFKIAEQDLLIRGPGHYFGRHQHGLNELRFAKPLTQIDILELARQEACDLIHKDPELKEMKHKHFQAIIKERFPSYLESARSG